LTGHKAGTVALLFAAGGDQLLSGGADGKVRFWNVKDGKQMSQLYASIDGITLLSLSKDGKTLATSGTDAIVRLWNLDTAKLTMSIPDRTAACFSPDGERLAVAMRSGLIELRDATTHNICTRLRGHTEAPECICFSTDGKRLASCGKDGRSLVWDALRGHLLAELHAHKGSRPYGIAIAGDGATLAGGDEDGRLLLWDLTGLGR
jgi:WD40 repeat protein